MRTTAFDIEVSNQNVILPERNMRPPLTGQPPHDHSSEYKKKAPPQTKCAFAFHPALQQPQFNDSCSRAQHAAMLEHPCILKFPEDVVFFAVVVAILDRPRVIVAPLLPLL